MCVYGPFLTLKTLSVSKIGYDIVFYLRGTELDTHLGMSLTPRVNIMYAIILSWLASLILRE